MSWPSVPIAEFCRTGSGTTPPRKRADFYEGEIPWVKSGELNGHIITSTEEHVSTSALKATVLKLVEPGALLIAMYGANVGRIAELGVSATTNQAICHIVPDPNRADRRYLYRCLEFLAAYFVRRGSGGAQPNISQKLIKETEIPLPPLAEQKRIAAILDEADRLRRLRQKSLDRLDQLAQSVFYEMFGDPASNPKRWPVGKIGDLLAEAKYGTSGKANTEQRGLPILRMGNLTYGGRIDLTDLKHIELSEKEFSKYTTRPGDLLFNRTNSKELVGKTAVVTQDEPLAIAGYLVRARANERGNTHYVSGYLNSAHGKAVLRGMCKNIVGMANINAREFQSIAIALPSPETQNEYANHLLNIRGHEKPIRQSLASLNTLFASLQQRAFRGEL